MTFSENACLGCGWGACSPPAFFLQVVGGYKKIEEGVVGGYKKMEEGVVSGFEKVSDHFIEKFFAHEGESVEEARKRLAKQAGDLNAEPPSGEGADRQ